MPFNSSFRRPVPGLLFVVLLVAGCGGSEPPAPAANPSPAPAEKAEPPRKDGPFTVTQSFPEQYTPGTEQTASVTMTYDGTEPVTALALQIKLPLGWQFGTITAGPKPAVTPKTGATDTVTLVWIQAPDFPATISYRVQVPDWSEGTVTLECEAIYRALAGELRSPADVIETSSPPRPAPDDH